MRLQIGKLTLGPSPSAVLEETVPDPRRIGLDLASKLLLVGELLLFKPPARGDGLFPTTLLYAVALVPDWVGVLLALFEKLLVYR